MRDLRVVPVDRGLSFEVSVNGIQIQAFPGETVAGVLLAAGINIFRKTQETDCERGQFCGMGVCYDCLVDVDERRSQRACMTAVNPGMRIVVPAFVKGQPK
ncbi:(2Fe-2S)-binding protein [Brucella cytisi]|uniref:(2Fe-2S)-binding protein n=1 Tax=Brucella cytisi TaxID=407152 RepID=UPI0035DDB0C1